MAIIALMAIADGNTNMHIMGIQCTVLYYWPQTQIAGPARASRIQDTEAGWFGLVVLAPGQACSGHLMDGNV